MDEQNFHFKLNNFQSNVLQSFSFMRNEAAFQDVVLVTDDRHHVSANKVILSASSEYFKDILMKVNHPRTLLCLEGVGFEVLNNILDYIHCGEILIPQNAIKEFLKVSQRFKLEGLFGVDKINEETKYESSLAISDNVIKEENNSVSDFQEKVPFSIKSGETKMAELPQRKTKKEIKKSKRINASSVHQEFIPVAGEHPKTKEIVLSSKCKYCDQVIIGNNPTNKKGHLQSFHPAVFDEVEGITFLLIK